MRVITAKSVNDALYQGCFHLSRFGIRNQSRNGPVFVSPMPVATVYQNPDRRVLVCEERDANPFFHLFESLWMLAGHNDVAFPAKFVGTMRQYSDDGEILHGAYGFRWRDWFGYDQLAAIVEMLQRDPSTRRAVLTMWSADNNGSSDLHIAEQGGKDVPCNTHAYFDTIDGRLNMTVLCRSNDVILGAYGANAVHFSILLEYMAAATGIPMGTYRQFSNNFHAYTELYSRIFGGVIGMDALERLGKAAEAADIYEKGVLPTPLIAEGEDPATFLLECGAFCDAVTSGIAFHPTTAFFKHTVAPMYATWLLWKAGDMQDAKHASLQIRADDWRIAAQSWLSIREMRAAGEE